MKNKTGSMKTTDFRKLIYGMGIDQKIRQMSMLAICVFESLGFAKGNFEKYHFGGLQSSGVGQN